ncbi:MAG TPA: DUF3987 domain-containing protein [Phycisphaerales bacterium]|nr:DUF3987 domain-containing protein [Phycisphaerales bacterium]
MSSPLEDLLECLRGAGCKPKRNGSEWTACCPAHDDHNPSLSVGIGDDGRVLLHCFAGCSAEAVCSALGLTTASLFSSANPQNGALSKGVFATSDEAVASLARTHGQPTGIWRYTDADGVEVGHAVRFDDPNDAGRKTVLPVSLHTDGWKVKAMPTPRPLYRLPELTGPGPIVVCEGEKAADAAATLGYTSTTSAGGCRAASKTDWSPLAGQDVVLIPDNDESGRLYAEHVITLLGGLDPKPTIRLVELPGIPESGDMVEFIGAQVGCEERARRELDALIEQAQPMAEVDLSQMVTSQATRAEEASPDDWPEPLPVPSPLPSVAAFDRSLLPEAFEPWITDIAERMQCPPDFPAVVAMIAAAGVLGRKVCIRPKKCDDWQVVPNLWGVLIGRPSMMKSPPLKEVMLPVKALIHSAELKHDQLLRAHIQSGQELDLRKAALESRIKSKLRKLEDAEDEMKELRGISNDLAAAVPTRRRHVVNDATVQALSEIMAENPNGVTLVRDELLGFLRSFDMESQQAARAFYIEAWDGSGSYESDRIGRGNTRVEAVCLSLIGTCQPGPLGGYLAEAIRGGTGDDGLMQRFQLAVWPDDPGPWVNVDRLPDSDARSTAYSVFTRLDTLDASSVGAERDQLDFESIPHLRFDDAAYGRFIEWMTERENRLRSGVEPPAIESHLAKYRSLIPSIALIGHLVDGGRGPVPLDPLERAIRWGTYLESHARRIYAPGIEPAIPAARALAEKILKGKLETGFVLRDVYRPRWSLLSGKGEANEAVDCLLELDWLRAEHIRTGGAPKTVYHVNPKALAEGFEPFAPD